MLEDKNEILKTQVLEEQKRELTGELETAHLNNLDVSLLSEKDLEMWDKFHKKGDGVNREEFQAYFDSTRKEGNASQIDFVGYLSNKLSSSWMKEDQEKRIAA